MTQRRHFPEPGEAGEILHGVLEHQSSAAPSARMLWDWLGFEYAAIDIDGTPGSIPLDLNFDVRPTSLSAPLQPRDQLRHNRTCGQSTQCLRV